MADYYTRFSLVLPLPDEAARSYALNLAEQASAARNALWQGDPLPTSLPVELADVIENWLFETEPDASGEKLWLHSEDGGIDAVCAFIQHLLQRFNPTGRITFEWSSDCSEPRVNAYGGGAASSPPGKSKLKTPPNGWPNK